MHIPESPYAIAKLGKLAGWRKRVSPRQQRDDPSPLELGTWPRTAPGMPRSACMSRPVPSHPVLCPVLSCPVLFRVVSCRAMPCRAVRDAPRRIHHARARRGTTEWLIEDWGGKEGEGGELSMEHRVPCTGYHSDRGHGELITVNLLAGSFPGYGY